jgi:hypothetical protein
MELTGGADCGLAGGDEKSERVEKEVTSGCSVRVDLPVRPRRTLYDKIAVGSEQEGMIGDCRGAFITRIISIAIWLFRHNNPLGAGLEKGKASCLCCKGVIRASGMDCEDKAVTMAVPQPFAGEGHRN